MAVIDIAKVFAYSARLASPSAPSLDPAAPLRGWPAFGRAVERLRRATGAGWVATTNYGLDAQLIRTGAVAAPVLQLDERRRYVDLEGPTRLDPAAAGLVIDLPRRLGAAELQRCFAVVRPLPMLDRGAAGGPTTPYLAFRVAQPRVDLLRTGCTLDKDRRAR